MLSFCAAAEAVAQTNPIPPPNDRIHEQQERRITLRAAVPSARETTEIFGVNLYARNIQPVWVEVRNESANAVVLTPMGLDIAYYSPRESAFRGADKRPLALLNEEFESKGITQLDIAPRSTQAGYVFTRVDEGTKSFNVDIVGDGEPYRMSFFVPVPGLKIDHHTVVFSDLYPDEEIRDVSLHELAAEMNAFICCVLDAAGKDMGDPLNLVLVGRPRDLFYAFLRAGWDETETINRASLWKTAVSAVFGGRYRYSPVSALYVYGRPQDIALQRARTSIHERNHLRLWMTPLRLDGLPVWIGQISRDIGVRFTRRTITTHKIDPDVDETRDFLLEDLAYAQSV